MIEYRVNAKDSEERERGSYFGRKKYSRDTRPRQLVSVNNLGSTVSYHNSNWRRININYFILLPQSVSCSIAAVQLLFLGVIMRIELLYTVAEGMTSLCDSAVPRVT